MTEARNTRTEPYLLSFVSGRHDLCAGEYGLIRLSCREADAAGPVDPRRGSQHPNRSATRPGRRSREPWTDPRRIRTPFGTLACSRLPR